MMRELGKFVVIVGVITHAGGLGDVGRVCAEMAGTIARRHPDRARTFCVLFSHRHLHHSQHPFEPAAIDLPTLMKMSSVNSDR